MNSWSSFPIGEHLFLFSPMIALIATMLVIVGAPLVAGRGSRTIAGVAVMGIAAGLVLSIRVAMHVGRGTSGFSLQPAAGLLIVDSVSAAFQIILFLFLAAVTYLWWIGSVETESNAPEFFILLLGSAFGMALMVSSTNLLGIVVAIETASLPSYALVGFDKRDRVAAEASLKYMIFGAVSAAIMLYGASLLYGLVGSLSVVDLAHYSITKFADGPPLLLIVGLLCFMAGIAFKISAVPMHFWCPDAFEGAKIEVTTWLSVVSKAAGLILLARLVSIFSGIIDSPRAMSILGPLAWALGLMAAVTCTVGNFAAYKQVSVKRMLAYSSIAHAGYMMMAATAFLHPATNQYATPASALLIYIVIYLFMNLGAFGVTAMIVWHEGNDRIDSFTGLIRRAPWLAVPMVICLVSLVGLPPLAGFLGKWWILLVLGSTGTPLAWILITVLAINTLISLYFYMRLVVVMTLRDDGRPEVKCPIGGVALVNACAAMLLIMFFFAQPMRAAADRYANSFYSTSSAKITQGDAPASTSIQSLSVSDSDDTLFPIYVQRIPPTQEHR
ncbi:MAG: NADH-quinone oxidoreductase subunit N [Planctomycetes bacterium]|nr:NADH-quinone oxidoreductase subunit N [Planctomycetota bacterium]MBI3834650.1 NADH-quinone oxidoreductase subunit N [Planctomycetota bacterium]